MDTQKEYLSVALGALLHDIGKFMQRAELDKEFSEIKKNYDDFCPLSLQKNYLTRLHAGHTAYFIDKYIPEGLLDKSELYNAARHHKNNKDDIYVIADHISSGMDRRSVDSYIDEEAEDGNKKYKKVRFHSVFDIVELSFSVTDDDEKYKAYWTHNFKPLNFLNKEDVFPKYIESAELTDDSQDYSSDYKSLWASFIGEFKKISKENLNFFFNELYSLLEKYTWCIPSDTNSYPSDISLFDHLRTTSAIATAIYYKQKENNEDKNEFLLFGGDISGIQDYIFRISNAQGIGGVAKALRGRSFYIMMLGEVISRYIIDKLGYTQANINFCGGGNFEILLANTEKNKQFLNKFECELNDWLLKEFDGHLALICAYVDIASDELKNDFGKCKEKLETLISRKKQKKFLSMISENDFWLERMNEYAYIKICPSCGLKRIEKEFEICDKCKLDRDIGKELPKNKYISFDYQKDNLSRITLPFGKFGVVNLYNDDDFVDILFEKPFIYSFSENNEKIFARYLLAKTLPYAICDIDEIDTEDDEEGEKTVYANQVFSFSTLADMSEGDKKLGILKMDIDNLGLIFSLGLNNKALSTGKERILKSISRLSTLSRNITYYFTKFVDGICEEVFNEWKDKKNWKDKDKVSNIFYIVFSGGDDLLIIGPWDQIIELAVKIRDNFKLFTCHNPNITLSAGIYICKPKYPINKAIEKADEALSRSKDKGRNRITVFGETTVWDEEDKKHSKIYNLELKNKYFNFEENEIKTEKIYVSGKEKRQHVLTFIELKEFANELLCYYENKKLKRGFVHRLLEMNEYFFKKDYDNKNGREEEDHNLFIFPHLFYNIQRNVSMEVKNEIKNYLISSQQAVEYCRQAKVTCKYFLMKTR